MDTPSNSPSESVSSMRPSSNLPLLSLLAILAALFGCCSAADRTSGNPDHQVEDAFRISSMREHNAPGSPLFRLCFDVVAKTNRDRVVTVECWISRVGAPFWLMEVRYPAGSRPERTDKALVTGAVVLATDALLARSRDPVLGVDLSPAEMPPDFAAALCTGVAARMSKLRSSVRHFDCREAQAIVREAYGDMDCVKAIASRIQDKGFAVRVDVAELCGLEPSTEGKKWKEVAKQPGAGVDLKSAVCCLRFRPQPPPRSTASRRTGGVPCANYPGPASFFCYAPAPPETKL